VPDSHTHLTIVADRDHLYINDYREERDNLVLYNLVLLRLSTGEELACVHLTATQPTIGGIIPGMHDDVVPDQQRGLGRHSR